MLRSGRFSLAGLLLAAVTAMSAQAAVLDEQALHALLVERVDVRKWGTGIVVGISSPQGRRIVSYGTLSVQDRRKVDGATVFEIASLTKVFTALVLADMAERQRVKLDAPVSTCLAADTKVPQHGGRQITFLDPEDIEAQFVFAESGTAPAQSLVLNQDGQSYKAERVAEESKP